MTVLVMSQCAPNSIMPIVHDRHFSGCRMRMSAHLSMRQPVPTFACVPLGDNFPAAISTVSMLHWCEGDSHCSGNAHFISFSFSFSTLVPNHKSEKPNFLRTGRLKTKRERKNEVINNFLLLLRLVTNICNGQITVTTNTVFVLVCSILTICLSSLSADQCSF